MNKKKIIEWTSRILWIMGSLFALSACVCLIIAFAQARPDEGFITFNLYKDGYFWDREAYQLSKFPITLYKASGYDAICAFLCYLASKITHWVAVKGE